MIALQKQKFWIVWAPTEGSPKVLHKDPWAAKNEAERLAQKHPGIPFYVLEAKELRVIETPMQSFVFKDVEESHF